LKYQYPQKGFTLIELVVAIVLLGIPGVAALGRFQDLSNGAESAKVDGIFATVNYYINTANNRYALLGSPANSTNVDLDGITVGYLNGFLQQVRRLHGLVNYN